MLGSVGNRVEQFPCDNPLTTWRDRSWCTKGYTSRSWKCPASCYSYPGFHVCAVFVPNGENKCVPYVDKGEYDVPGIVLTLHETSNEHSNDCRFYLFLVGCLQACVWIPSTPRLVVVDLWGKKNVLVGAMDPPPTRLVGLLRKRVRGIPPPAPPACWSA